MVIFRLSLIRSLMFSALTVFWTKTPWSWLKRKPLDITVVMLEETTLIWPEAFSLNDDQVRFAKKHNQGVCPW